MKKSVVTFLKGIVSVISVLVFVIAISGCEKQDRTLEKAGKKADEGIEAVKDGMKKAGEKVSEGAEKAEKAVKKAGEKVEEKVKK